jgi:hypothetical protein
MPKVEEGFTFMEMDKGGLTRCSASKEVCPHPMVCKRRSPKALEPSMNFRTIGHEDLECLFFVKHEMIHDEKHAIRGRHRKHNKHAPAAGSQAPDLMVKRHIRSGKDINNASS